MVGRRVATTRSRVRSPAGTRLCNDSGQVVHTDTGSLSTQILFAQNTSHLNAASGKSS